MLTCQEIATLLSDYLEGRLSLWQRMTFHMHLGMCAGCRAYLRQLRVTIGMVRRLEPADVPPEMMEALVRRFRDWNP